MVPDSSSPATQNISLSRLEMIGQFDLLGVGATSNQEGERICRHCHGRGRDLAGFKLKSLVRLKHYDCICDSVMLALVGFQRSDCFVGCICKLVSLGFCELDELVDKLSRLEQIVRRKI